MSSPSCARAGPSKSPRVSQAALPSDQDQDVEQSHLVDRPVLHIEARLRPTSNIRIDIIKQLLASFITSNYVRICVNQEIRDFDDIDVLHDNLDLVRVEECSMQPDENIVQIDSVSLEIHVYQNVDSAIGKEFGLGLDEDSSEGEGESSAATITDLPNINIEGIWQSLMYDDQIKENIMKYIYTTLLFGQQGVDNTLICYNRVVLLHGPPGTGKTSLCRALAQKMSIRLQYVRYRLVEINSHSLFSKWFSESGKLVGKLFANILDIADDPDCFVVVLIDEVESLTSARAGAISGREPSDALRVVNALLTQLDKLKLRTNVLVVATSNLSHAIDPAFIDRADIKQFIGLPSTQAIYTILAGCMAELMRRKLVAHCELFDFADVALIEEAELVSTPEGRSTDDDAQPVRKKQKTDYRKASLQLLGLAKKCHSLVAFYVDCRS